MQALSDRIQKKAKIRPDLAALCEFSATMQMRRLRLVPPTAWQMLEVRWAGHLLAKLHELKQNAGVEATLALACLGFAREGLEEAIDRLGTPIQETPPPLVETPKPGGKGKAEKTTTRNKAALASSPEVEADEELDADTQAMLAALREETQKLKR